MQLFRQQRGPHAPRANPYAGPRQRGLRACMPNVRPSSSSSSKGMRHQCAYHGGVAPERSVIRVLAPRYSPWPGRRSRTGDAAVPWSADGRWFACKCGGTRRLLPSCSPLQPTSASKRTSRHTLETGTTSRHNAVLAVLCLGNVPWQPGSLQSGPLAVAVQSSRRLWCV